MKTLCPRCGGEGEGDRHDVYVCSDCLTVWSDELASSRLRKCPICGSRIVGTKFTQHNRLVLSNDWEVLAAEDSGETHWSVRCENGHSVMEMINRARDPGNSAP